MHGALVGYGTIAAGHHDAYLRMRDLRIVAVVDAVERRRDAAKQRDRHVRVYSSLPELLDRERIDFVDICSPPSCHLEHQLRALEASCHVLCEKPFLLDPDDFRRVLPQVDRGAPFLYPSHNYKFSPALQHLREQVHSADFGEILSGHFRTLRNGHARGVPDWKPDWRRMPEYAGGGILRDHGTHSIYLACQLSQQDLQSVSCTLGNVRDDGFRDTEDTAALVLEFAGGLEIRIDLTWASNRRSTSYAVSGAKQSIIIENDNVLLTGLGETTNRRFASEFDDPSHKAWFGPMFHDFLDSIGDVRKQSSLLAEAWTTSAAVAAAYVSASRGGDRQRLEPPPARIRREEPAA